MGNRRKKYSSSSSSSSSSSDSSSSSSSDSSDKHKKHPSKFKLRKERRDKRKRLRKYSDSSTSSDTEADYERKRLKKEIKREQRKAKRLKMKLKDKQIKLSNNQVEPSKDGNDVNESCDIPIDLMEQSKSMAPMTKEEWEKRQSVVKRVYDKETDRYRLVKGDGEILEEIISRDKHLEINKKATQGDGLHFQTQLASTIKR